MHIAPCLPSFMPSTRQIASASSWQRITSGRDLCNGIATVRSGDWQSPDREPVRPLRALFHSANIGILYVRVRPRERRTFAPFSMGVSEISVLRIVCVCSSSERFLLPACYTRDQREFCIVRRLHVAEYTVGEREDLVVTLLRRFPLFIRVARVRVLRDARKVMNRCFWKRHKTFASLKIKRNLVHCRYM